MGILFNVTNDAQGCLLKHIVGLSSKEHLAMNAHNDYYSL